MPNKKLMQRVLQMIRDPHFKVTKRRDFVRARGDPAEPFADSKDVRVDCETRALQTKEDDTGSRFGTNAWVFH
jgi:hypothetical protein